MNGIMDLIQQQITPETVNQISQEIGEDPVKTRQAIDAALPHLAGAAEGMAGTDNPDASVARFAGDETMLGGLGGMMSGGSSGGGILGGLGGLGGLAGMMGGGGILGSILGGKQDEVQDGVAKQSGVNPQKVGQILMLLAPIIFQAISKYRARPDQPG